jgi:competence protein ComEC
MARRRSKKKQMKMIKTLISIVIVLILGLISFITEPWQYIGGDQTEIGTKNEADVSDLQVHYIDVGQADAILVRAPSEKGTVDMLIDAGTSSGYPDEVITDYLDDLGIDTLTYMIITHPHLDHGGAAKEVIEAVEVKNVILPECDAGQVFWLDMLEAMDERSLSYIPSEIGDTYKVGEASFTILGPVDTSKVKDTNDYSIVIRLDYGETSFVFTGDATVESEALMLDANPASAFKCDVLKIGHHGSHTSTSEAFLKACAPSMAIISCGEGNSYGHPHDVILDRLEKAGIPFLRTDKQGTIIFVSDKNEVNRLTKK